MPNHGGMRISIAACLVCVALLTGVSCKHKAVTVPQPHAPVRIVLLPLNVPADDAELRWLATASTVLVAEGIDGSTDLDIVPLWESMPVTKETVGDSRSITPENAEYIASRLTAKWATQGEITSDKAGMAVLIDFIPAKATLVPFRYENKGPANALGGFMREAIVQFLRYLVAQPLKEGKAPDVASIRPVAEAIDREYGWFVEAQPGKSEAVVSAFARANKELGGVLFNPNLYPGLETKKAPPPPAAPAPVVVPPPATPAPASPAPASPPPASPTPDAAVGNPGSPAAATAPAAPAEDDAEFVPPPRTFTQRIVPASLAESRTDPVKPTAPPPARVDTPPAMNKASPENRPGQFGIQVLATRGKAEAEALSARLARAGFTPGIEEADLKEKGMWYRVRLPGYASRSAATQAADKLRADGVIREYWIVPPSR